MDIPYQNMTTDVNQSIMVDSVELEPFCSGLIGNGSVNNSACVQPAPGVSMAPPICMFITGVLGNILALAVLHTIRRELRKTPYYILLLGLAWSDLFSQLMTSPVTIFVYANNLKWQGGKPLCVYSAFVMIGFGIILPVLVFWLSVERLLALKFTYVYSRIVTLRRAKWLFFICWLCVISFCTLPLVGFGSYEHQYPGTWCFLNFHNESSTDTAYASMFAIFNVTVILGIVICNSAVVVTLLNMRKRHNSPHLERRFEPPRKSILQMEMETQMVWFLCAVTIVFVTCWLPLNVHILINLTTGVVNYATDLNFIRFASINQILDPWLYILLRKSVLLKISGVLRKVFNCRKKKSDKTKSEKAHIMLGVLDTNGWHHKAQYQRTPARKQISIQNGRETTLPGIQSEVFITCEQNDGNKDIVSVDTDSSDSDLFLDSNSSRYFPNVYDPDRPRLSAGFFSVSRHKGSTGDNSNHKTLCRMLSLPVDIRT